MIIRNNGQTVKLAQKLITDWNKEHSVGVYVKANAELIRAEVLTIGSLVGNLITPREIFKPALLCNAASLVLLHNHPSGNIRPSVGDLKTTRQLLKAAEILMIPIQDHIVFSAGNQYYSLINRKIYTI